MKGEMKMKRFLCVLLACLMVTPAFADFAEDFDLFSEMYGIEPLTFIQEDKTGLNYTCGDVIITYADGSATVIGKNALDVITVSCCVLQCFDNNMMNFKDQRGSLLHAYFMYRKGAENAHSFTNSGINILIKSYDDYFCIGMGK